MGYLSNCDRLAGGTVEHGIIKALIGCQDCVNLIFDIQRFADGVRIPPHRKDALPFRLFIDGPLKHPPDEVTTVRLLVAMRPVHRGQNAVQVVQMVLLRVQP